MSRKINEKFLSLFLELDKLCCEKFGVANNGVTEYINRLNNARFAPDRDEVLPKLVNYRNIRNKFAQDANEIRKNTELTKDDLKWVKDFEKDLKKKKDPISVYLNKARRYASRRRFLRFLFIALIIILIGGGAAAAALLLL